MQSLTVKGQIREQLGKRAARAIRRKGSIPCELYGVEENIHFTVKPLDIKHLVYTPDFKLADIDIDGQVHRCLMKSIQFHPVTDAIIHVDFLKLRDDRKVKVEVPVRYEGVSPGVKGGGNLTEKVKKVGIKAFPAQLVEEVILDISELNLGQSVRIRDIHISDDIEILNNPNIPVASVEIPRALKSAAEEAAEAAEAEEAEAAEEEGIEGETTGNAAE